MSEKKSKLPESPVERERLIALGASFFCAGLGQFVQKKWLFGILYLVAFLGPLLVFLYAMKQFTMGYLDNFEKGLDLLHGDVLSWAKLSGACATMTVVVWIVCIIHTQLTARARIRAATATTAAAE